MHVFGNRDLTRFGMTVLRFEVKDWGWNYGFAAGDCNIYCQKLEILHMEFDSGFAYQWFDEARRRKSHFSFEAFAIIHYIIS